MPSYDVGTSPMRLDLETLRRVGKNVVQAVVQEAKADAARQRAMRGKPSGVPHSPEFYDSFGYRVVGQHVELTCSWPTIDLLVSGAKPFPLDHLTREAGVPVVPVKSGSRVIFRTTPATRAEAWVHPGFASHEFITRGIRKGLLRSVPLVAGAAVRSVVSGLFK